jgi:hypothetical protein
MNEELAEIKRLYYRTTPATIEQDLAKAIALLKAMSSDEEREKAAAFMDGLSEMRSDWARREKRKRKGASPPVAAVPAQFFRDRKALKPK